MLYKICIKTMIDVVIAFIALIILFPFLFIISIILAFHFKGNPFFVQPRPGKNNKIIYVVKFKSMDDLRDENDILSKDNERLTSIGRVLRKTSLDEIPQLFNVLKGDLSIIGPRPLLVEYLPLYSEFQKRRHEVKPGITGWAQVNGRNAISWEEKFKLDVWYVDNVSFKTDFKIILLSIVKVFKAKDINYSDIITMEKFKGNIL